MSKNIIHIFGASGSGTSTLGKYICEKMNYYFMDTDDYYWMPTNPPYTVKRDKSERISLMKKDILNHDNVVISGSLVDWGDELIPMFTLAIRMITNKEVRLERLKVREKAHFGSRIEPGGDMYADHIAFLEWAASYDTGDITIRSKALHDEWIKNLTCKLIELDGTESLDKLFETVLKNIKWGFYGIN